MNIQNKNNREPRFVREASKYNIDKYVAQLKTALIVEDDPAFAEIVRMHLDSWNYSVVTATDGVQGVRRVMAHDFDVIICDMLMPNLAGDMFYRAVERVRPHLCKKFIFMTGNHNDPKICEFIRKVRGVILWKPFQFHILHETIEAVNKKNLTKQSPIISSPQLCEHPLAH